MNVRNNVVTYAKVEKKIEQNNEKHLYLIHSTNEIQ
jgi:hypothetical protein